MCDSCLIGHSPLVGEPPLSPSLSPPAWAGAADEWQRITDEDTVTHLTLLHSRGGGVVVVMGKGGKGRGGEH